MPVALFTYHGYGTWLADRPRGYVERHGGIQPPSEALGAIQRRSMTQNAFYFDESTQRLLIERFIELCGQETLRAHAGASEYSHVHLIASWYDEARTIHKVSARVKNLLSLHFSRTIGPVGRKWFAQGGSKRQVEDQRHFDYLVKEYLPSHRGVFWSEETGWRDALT